MKSEKIFNQWKLARSDASLPADFPDRVMLAIAARQSTAADTAQDRWLPSLAGRWSAAAALLGLGLIRILFMLGNLMAAGTVAP